MKTNRKFRQYISAGLVLAMVHGHVHAGATDIATAPLVTSPSASVLPNLMFILDDSGSMDSDFVPDWANSGTSSLFKNVDYNGQAYDPSVTYSPPTYYTSSGSLDTTTHFPMTPGANTQKTSGGSQCSTDFCYVKDDGYGVQSTNRTDLSGTNTYYTFIPGEYCTSANLRLCKDQTAPSTTYPFPAVLRWCTNSTEATRVNPADPLASGAVNPNCQAARIENGTTYLSRRYAGMQRPTSTITVTNAANTPATTTSIKVNGLEILSAATAGSTNSNQNTRNNTNASQIQANIAACTSAITGNCQVAGYTASVNNNVVTITPPDLLGNITFTPATTVSGTMTLTTTAFSGGLPGGNVQVNISSGTNSYTYPGLSTKHSSRTDCTGTTCTYSEEMTNYANWWAYYRTRMQMMKTAASTAFKPIDTKYRVGFFTINQNVSNKSFLNVDKFDNTQKKAWYDKFFASNPNNSTPLREALSTVGRYYAGKLNGNTISGVTVVDPMQYSCQQNFTLLTTDGYWNGNAGFQIDGSSAIGNPDGLEPRPFNDGANLIITQVTPTATVTRKRTVQPLQRTTTWTRQNNVIGAGCTMLQGPVPTSCVADNGNNSGGASRTWCMVDSLTGEGANNQCTSAIGTSPSVYTCRGTGSTGAVPPGGNPSACKTDGGGNTWCVFTSNNPTGTVSGSCVNVLGGGNNVYTCRMATQSANLLTVQNQTYDQVETGSSSDSTDDFTHTTYSTTVITNGTPGTPQANTPSPTDTVTNVIPVTSSSYTSNTGAPTAGTTWTTGSSTGPTCTAAASLPAAGGTTPVSATAVVTNTGTAAVTNISTTGPTTGAPTTTSTSSTGGVSNTLADVAEYYYVTDLRDSSQGNCTGAPVPPATTGNDVCNDDVAGTAPNSASWQHMTTFTLGLANGVMQFSPTYLTQTSGDYFDVKNGSNADPSTGRCGWQGSGTSCNWPTPASDRQENIDDLWHAAVNGRGTAFQATNPNALTAGLNSALAGVNAVTGSSAAATTSNPNVTSGDNFVFSSTFTTVEWDGELVRQQLDLTSGAVSNTIDWAAQAQLDSLSWPTRNVYMYDATDTTVVTGTPGTGDKLKLFTWANMNSTEQAYFNKPAINTLSQFCSAGATCLTSSDQTTASGQNLVNYLRGERAYEGIAADPTTFYRARTHILGDVVNAEAVYVKAPLFNYGDAVTPDYSTYKSTQSTRQGMVYVASNDGMLHAFNASTGAEVWTYVPTAVLPNLFKLADKNYRAQHGYFVDGTPTTADVYDGTKWRTILIGGLNGGGKAYYALDITVPNAPVALWEFTDTNLGFTYGNPVVSKLKCTPVSPATSCAGTWVAFLTSGYNNHTNGGDGVGRLYVVNAVTGALIRSISTGVGDNSTPNPSGLAKINAWVDNTDSDNTTLRVYGGDLLGNVWRFDVNGDIGASGYDAQRLITLYSDTAGTIPQPITTKPELGEVTSNAVIYVGTGRYLGTSDLADTQKQTFYAIKDALGSTALGNARDASAAGPKFVQQVATNTTCPAGSPATICSTGQKVRTSTANTVNFATNNGWYIDLPDSGERANTDPTLALGTLGFTTNVPNTSACSAGGTSWRWLLDYRSGAPVSTSTTGVSSVNLGNALATRAVFVRLPNNTVVQLTRMSDGSTVTTNVPLGTGAGTARRISWRELITDQ